MRSHPHVHLLVTAGGLSRDGTQGLAPKHPAYLVPVEALSPIFRAKMCAGLKQAGLLDQVPPAVWQKNWVVHCQPAGRGPQVLDYLGRYVFRIAISNRRLERLEAGQVTFRYRDHRTQTLRRVTLSGVEFLHRFLQHVLPPGYTKVRHSGLWSPTVRGPLAHAGLPRVRGVVSQGCGAGSSWPEVPRCLPTQDRSSPPPSARPPQHCLLTPHATPHRIEIPSTLPSPDLVQPRILSRRRATRILNSLV